jgi:uncharacterized protein (AIM24 family)
MKTDINFQDNFTSISKMQSKNSSFEVLEYNKLSGGGNDIVAEKIFRMNRANIKLNQVKITLNDGKVKLEAGALHFMNGDIEIKSDDGGIGGLAKKIFSSSATGESTFKPEYSGIGEIFLEPSFGNYALIELENEEIIVGAGLFYACESSVEVGVSALGVTTAIKSGKGMFQTRLTGTGLVALEVPVPDFEIIKYSLNGDTLKVDGDFVILRSGDLNFTVEKSTKGLLSSASTGEVYLNVYKGTGEVWVVPTKYIYDKLTPIPTMQ